MLKEAQRTETREVRDFDQVILRDYSCGAEVHIEQGDAQSLRIEAKPDILRRIETQVRDGKLTIRLGGSWLERLSDKLSTSLTRPKIVYRLQVRELRSLDLVCAAGVYAPSLRTDDLRINVGGAAHVVVEDLRTRDLRIEHSGAGEIAVAGQADRQEVLLTGVGSYNAEELRTQVSLVRISGSAHARVHASQELEVVMRGLGTVEYWGTPRLRQRIKGMGRVIRLG